jgi:hypothetical protein
VNLFGVAMLFGFIAIFGFGWYAVAGSIWVAFWVLFDLSRAVRRFANRSAKPS